MDKHPSPQAAVDYAVDRVLAGKSTAVTIRNHETVVINFVPRETEAVTVQQRIGDGLRQERLDLLGLAFVQGFITQPEYDERAGAVLAATTEAELDPLIRDLAEVKREEPKIVPHRHKACVDLPAVIMFISVAIFVISLIIFSRTGG